MVKRASIKGKGKSLLFEEAAKSIKEELTAKEEIKAKKEKKKVGKREDDIKEKIKTQKETEVKTTKEITFEEKHPLLTKEPFYKVSVCLSEKENEYLESLGKKAKLTGGNKLPKNIIIRGFVKAFMDVKLDVDGLKKDDDKVLFERVREFIKK
jgi:hypothetical protein